MHAAPIDSKTPETGPTIAWWKMLNRYQWLIFAFAAMGWMFDTMDQQLFTASRSLAMKSLLPDRSMEIQTQYGSWATSLFIIGWASGGLIFGVMGDKWGRVKTMGVTILMYSLFTGLSALAKTFSVFALGRFLTGFGVGGEFAVGAALVAEVMPDKARPHALGMLQALSAVGNLTAAKLLGWVAPHFGWQGLYYIGTLPAIVGLLVFWRLREPEKFMAAKAAAKARTSGALEMGRMKDLFAIPRWRRNTLVGLALAIAGVVGLWGAGFWSPELIDSTLPTLSLENREQMAKVLAAPADQQAQVLQGLTPAAQKKFIEFRKRDLNPGQKMAEDQLASSPLTGVETERMQSLLKKAMPENEKTRLKSDALVLQQLGAFVGLYGFGWVSARIGRRKTFLIALLMGWMSILLAFGTFQDRSQIWYLWPILGFGALGVFGGYAIYLPELFPTRLRSTGTGFCYNVGRFIAALGPLTLGQLGLMLSGRFALPGFRIAAMIVGTSYLLGVVALIWAPETLNQPLPEDEAVETAELV